MSTPPPPGASIAPSAAPPAAPATAVREWAEMIKIEHTVFALPFALSGMVLASRGLPDWRTVLWTVVAFAGARAAAMTLNRLIDAEIDSRNPRTSMRAIPAGRIGKRQALLFAVASFAVMVSAAAQLPPLCLWLSPIAIFWLSLYSYTKRFTWACHFALGVALAGAALGGWVAASGGVAGAAPWILAFAVGTWVAGFDLIYACQDIDFDRHERLYSFPARFGLKAALAVSSSLHVATVAALVLLGLDLHLGPVYWAGAALVAGMLFWEHSLVRPDDLSKVDAAFFNVNGCVSIAAFLAILVDRWLALG